jgi:hypothetical protein
MMLLDGIVGMSTALDVNSSGVRNLSRTGVLNKSVATWRLARSLASSGNLPTPAAGTCRLAGSSLVEDPEGRE